MLRLIQDGEISELKGHTDAALRLGGGMTSFALMTRVNVGQLSKYAGNGCENRDYLIPVDIALEADRRAGSPVITGALARLQGFRLVADDGEAGEASALTDEDAMAMMDEATEFWRLWRQAKADGRIDAREREALKGELFKIIRAATGVLKKV